MPSSPLASPISSAAQHIPFDIWPRISRWAISMPLGMTVPIVANGIRSPTRLPYTPGGEIAGVVSAVGEGVDLEVGTAVAVLGGGLREQNIVGAGSCFAYPADALSAAQ
ncbi:MAG: hypothetical protein EBY49_10065, partial [Actinobacteria bacterium]|nr:hypothetical protein [Actinomycetota bacterium]